MSEAASPIAETLAAVVKEFLAKGSRFAQTKPVILETLRRLGPHRRDELKTEQAVLRAYYAMFKNGTLHWGYDANNPGPPFFHVADE
ncbi:hypothetical protein [Chondromyces crocatus]|uniref:Uncharacterized protein n=1 Tax=Chondromyces crocatus TaxID=52 RepID=A0A0K1EJ94_CHOCO|nr:hypothetical protein [Chondromyces crocatus]AKT40648.1 uncharacterized protein CMC5_048040 [Chondromyces crocatus]